MDQELLDKHANVFLEGIKFKLSEFLIEGRNFDLPAYQQETIKEIMKEWLTDFYNEASENG